MGAAAAVELTKPSDASDIISTNDLNFAKSEIIRLRKELGHLAAAYGVHAIDTEAKDLVLGVDEKEDFQRCVREIAHIRQCLRLNTQQSMRQQRSRNYTRTSSSSQFVPLREVGRLSEERKYDSKHDDDSKGNSSDDDTASNDD